MSRFIGFVLFIQFRSLRHRPHKIPVQSPKLVAGREARIGNIEREQNSLEGNILQVLRIRALGTDKTSLIEGRERPTVEQGDAKINDRNRGQGWPEVVLPAGAQGQ